MATHTGIIAPSSKVWQMSYKFIGHFAMKKLWNIVLYDIFKLYPNAEQGQ